MKKRIFRLLSLVGLLYPLLLLMFLLDFNNFTFKSIITNAAFAFFVYTLGFLFSKDNKIIKSIFNFFSILYFLILSLDCSLAFLFKNTLTRSMSYIFLGSNTLESKDFIQSYFSLDLLLLICSILFFTIIGMFFFNKIKYENKFQFRWVYFMLVLISSGVLYFGHSHFIPTVLIESHKYYLDNIDIYKSVYSNKNGGKFSHVECRNDSLTAIVIIGESATTHHMSLYGYPRQTNPLLSQEKNLVVFKNVKSPYCSTVASLTEVLTFSNLTNENRKMDGSVIQLCNRAGFYSYWISNQLSFGNLDNQIVRLSSSCNSSFFSAGSKKESCNAYDEILFDQIDRALNNPHPKKVIFVHLMGSHLKYIHRYPKKFNHFRDQFPMNYFGVKSVDKSQHINEYDNSILYSDWIVNSIIMRLKKSNTSSCVLYFSDHGEDVYETGKHNRLGHSDDLSTEPMHDIPFLIWTSNSYNLRQSMDYDVNSPYCTDNLMYSVADLLGINFDEMNKNLSVFK